MSEQGVASIGTSSPEISLLLRHGDTLTLSRSNLGRCGGTTWGREEMGGRGGGRWEGEVVREEEVVWEGGDEGKDEEKGRTKMRI